MTGPDGEAFERCMAVGGVASCGSPAGTSLFDAGRDATYPDDGPPMGIDDMSTEHMSNWFDCMRSRHQPVATVRDGFAQSVACIMAAQSYFSGKKLYWDAAKEEITDRVS